MNLELRSSLLVEFALHVMNGIARIGIGSDHVREIGVKTRPTSHMKTSSTFCCG